ncbi:hypothetical protein ACODT3_10515 [Streptomyces sp. 4.24]|uniref:hypothetical protein n=1 Tax=Streptomyces tritrimontium TaxID=3406573 RepID=UPI003BB75F20
MSRVIGSIGVDLGSGPIEAAYGLDSWDSEFGMLKLGDTVTLHINNTSPDTLRELAQAALELAAFREQQLAADVECAA